MYNQHYQYNIEINANFCTRNLYDDERVENSLEATEKICRHSALNTALNLPSLLKTS
jgi:hypothetical protein